MPVALTKENEMAAHWKSQIEQCDKATNNWHKRGEKILKHFRDEREQQDAGVAKRLNLFWSNSKVKNPAVYSKAPVPICERRFLDKDPTGRVAATILERALRYEMPTSGFHKTLKRCRTDWSMVGRGQVWIRYNPKFGMAISPEQTADNDIDINGKLVDEDEEQNDEAQEREFLSESLCVDYVHWKDFYIFPASARTWDEVEGVGRKILMSRQDCIDNFGESIGKEIELDCKPKTDGNQGGESTLSGKDGMQATTYEIWWKPLKKVYFIAQSYLKLCKEVDDPLKLENFFPCPEPWSATMTNDSLIPVPDYAECQDQYMQIDELSKRIDILTASCKVVGVYDASAQALKRVFQEAQEPNLIPVDSWAMFAEKGGLKGAIDWVPIEQIAAALKILIEVRQQMIQDLDRLTGINDIMRGTSDARETMGAQRLKTNGANIRIDDDKDEASRFCRDIIAIMGELIAEHYDPTTLIQVSGSMYDEGLDPPEEPAPNPMMGHNGGPPLAPPLAPPLSPPAGALPPQAGPIPPAAPPSQPAAPMPAGAPPMGMGPPPISPEIVKQQRKDKMIADAIMLLRNDKLRGFRIDIETDSTVQPDAQEEKEQRISFIEGVTKFIEQSSQVMMAVPEFGPLAAKMLQFAVRGFRVGRDLESSIEDFCEKAEQKAKQAANSPQPPSPEQIKADSERYKADKEVERQHLENEGEMRNNMIDLESKKLDVRMKEMELEMKRLEFHAKMNEPMEGEEGEGTTKVHPHLALNQIAEAAKVFDLASKRNAAPRRIVRGPDGKASHVVTDFQENA
jgi:hypothetical protein